MHSCPHGRFCNAKWYTCCLCLVQLILCWCRLDLARCDGPRLLSTRDSTLTVCMHVLEWTHILLFKRVADLSIMESWASKSISKQCSPDYYYCCIAKAFVDVCLGKGQEMGNVSAEEAAGGTSAHCFCATTVMIKAAHIYMQGGCYTRRCKQLQQLTEARSNSMT